MIRYTNIAPADSPRIDRLDLHAPLYSHRMRDCSMFPACQFVSAAGRSRRTPERSLVHHGKLDEIIVGFFIITLAVVSPNPSKLPPHESPVSPFHKFWRSCLWDQLKSLCVRCLCTRAP